MKDAVCTGYGPPEFLEIQEVDKPVPEGVEVLVKFLFFVMLVLVSGCICCFNNTSVEDFEVPFKSLTDFSAGVRESSDIDNDGIDDKFILTYETEEVADDLFLDKKIEYLKTSSGFDGDLILEFENKGESREHTYNEVVPKEFAKAVKDIRFSIPPTRIIKDDPELEWDFKVQKDKIVRFEMRVKGDDGVVEVFDAFDKVKNFNLCNKLTGKEREICFIGAVGNLKNPSVSDCDILAEQGAKDNCILGVAAAKNELTICEKHILDESTRAHCYAIFAAVNNDKSICEKITSKAERTVCLLAFESKEKNTSLGELYQDKVEGQKEDSKDHVYLDILINPNDEKRLTGRTYTFEALADPVDSIPSTPRYMFSFSDGYSVNSSSKRIEKRFNQTGTVRYTVKLFDTGLDKIVASQSSSVEVIEGEGEREKEEEMKKSLREDQCEEDTEECAESCNTVCEQKKYEYCRKYEYSGCALDVFCWCNACGHIYNKKWCGYSESYKGCAVGVLGKYKSCIQNCNSKREGGQSVTTCGFDCNAEMIEELDSNCKDEPCKKFCESKGYAEGIWARYTKEYSWDSCNCSKKT